MTKEEFLAEARGHLAIIRDCRDGNKWAEWVDGDPEYRALLDRQVNEQIAFLEARLEK